MNIPFVACAEVLTAKRKSLAIQHTFAASDTLAYEAVQGGIHMQMRCTSHQLPLIPISMKFSIFIIYSILMLQLINVDLPHIHQPTNQLYRLIVWFTYAVIE